MTRRSKREIDRAADRLEEEIPGGIEDAHPVVRAWIDAGADIPRELWNDPAGALMHNLRAQHQDGEGGRSA